MAPSPACSFDTLPLKAGIGPKGNDMHPEKLELKDALKQYRHDQDKIISPEKTVARFKKRLVDNNLDILDEIVRVDNGRLGIPVYFSVYGQEARSLVGKHKQMGKGATPEQAQASAVMELGERFSLFSFYRTPDNFITAPQNSIKSPCMPFEQIARSVNDDIDDLAVSSHFFSELPFQWTWAHNLTKGTVELIPFNWFWAINQYNGSSAGNCIEEALCQGICEIVERHVSAIISRNKIKVPNIEVDTINDPVAKQLIDKFRKAGIQFLLSDFTLDMGIPTVGALAWDPSTFPEKSEIVWTAGTMPSAPKALCRALTEVAQLAGDFNSNVNYEASGLPKFRSLQAADYVINSERSVTLDNLPEIGDNNIKTEVENCIRAFSHRGMDVYAVDIRHPKLNIPAFYTIIPGAQFRERASHSSVGMIMAKIMLETYSADQALKSLHHFDTQLPNKYYTQFYLGQLHLNENRFEAALDHFNKAVERQPPAEDLATVYTYIGVCHKEMEHYEKAQRILERSHSIDSERTDTLNLLGFCYYKLKQHARAISCFEELVAIDPSSAIDYANIASNYRAMGKKAEAIEYYQLALTLDSTIEFAREHLIQMGINP